MQDVISSNTLAPPVVHKTKKGVIDDPKSSDLTADKKAENMSLQFLNLIALQDDRLLTKQISANSQLLTALVQYNL